jgi:hypothetical protein
MSLHRAALAIAIALVSSVQSQSGTAAITGTVVTLSSGEPIAEASVSLYASTLAAGHVSTTTDSQGRFQFTNLAPGRYTVGAEKAGFVHVVFGERHYGRGGRAIPLRDAERRDIRLQLPRTSVITGRIVDAAGNPAIRASVRAVRFSMAFGYRRAESVGSGSATTDAKGIFRIESLTQGDYAVCASTHETTPLNEAQRLQMTIDRQRGLVTYVRDPEGVAEQKRLAPRLAELEAQLPRYVPPVRGYAPLCYPDATSPASMITLAPDEQRGGVDMQFVATRLARIEGIVTGLPPDNRDVEPIMLLSDDDVRAEGPPADGARPDMNGRFTFTNVPPGIYKIFLRSATDGPSHGARTSAAVQVIVADEDIRNVVLDLQPGVTVSGHVAFRGTHAQPPADLTARAGLEVRLDPAVPGPLTVWPGSSITHPDASGQFVLHDVFPGEYRISTNQRVPTGWFFDTTAIPGADVRGQLVEVKRQDLAGITVTLTDRRGEISGTILTGKGQPAPEYYILVYPSDEKYWTPYSLRVRGTRANQDGAFVLDGLPAGSYRLATLLDAEFGRWFDPAFLRGIDPSSMAVSIGDAERKVLNLRVPGDR